MKRARLIQPRQTQRSPEVMQRILKAVRFNFENGKRVELVKRVSNELPEEGTQGEVVDVQDNATVIVKWDNGVQAGVVYGVDICKILKTTENE